MIPTKTLTMLSLYILICFGLVTIVQGFQGEFDGQLCNNITDKQEVYPQNVKLFTISKYVKQIQFQLNIKRNCTLMFNVKSSMDNDGEISCFMDGFVYMSNSLYPVELALCDGIAGEFTMVDLNIVLRIQPLLHKDSSQVTIEELSTTPHLLTKDRPLYTETNNVVSHRIRSRRAPRKSTVLTLINKSGRVVLLYYMDTWSHRRRYFLRLRLNEKNLVTSHIGTTWLAYDRQQNPLLLNGRFNFLVHPDIAGQDDVKIVVSSKTSISSAIRLQQLPERKQKFVELLVVADASMVKHHGSKTKKYIETLIDLVNTMFQHKSLNASVHIVMTHLKILKTKTNLLKISNTTDSHKALMVACKYTYDLKKKERWIFDFSVTLTRKKFGVSGFTPLYRMCVEYKSCTVVNDAGMHSAFIIAHEIGHAIGLSHDGDHNECGPEGAQGSIMYPIVYSKFTKYHWSKCTKFEIRENLGYFPCLNNKPKEFVVKTATDLPGVSYNIDDQCQQYHGTGYKNCLGRRGSDQYCNILFCRIPGKRNKCTYFALPPIDGTKCGEGKWCIKGKCFQQGLLGPVPINGSWSTWQQWSTCSSSCGAGIRLRKRTCDDPLPEYGGKECNGSSSDWKPCNGKPCYYQRAFSDIRAEMCYHKSGKRLSWLNKAEMEAEVSRLNLSCTFEHDLCGWHQVNDSKTTWIRHSGETPTKLTGPRHDHTYKNNAGRYLLMESSNPLRKGDKMQITSSKIITPKVCLRFYYHMYGNKMGLLRVNKSDSETVWKMFGNQGQEWRLAEVSIQHQKEYQIIIEAVRGSSYLSDISIDDVTLTPGLCKKDDIMCALHCRNTQTRDNKEFVVPNGSACDSHTSNVCVHGKCQVLGCNGKIGSNVTTDKCGVCGGDGSSCTLYYEILRITPENAANTILKIPVGSTNIFLWKLTPGDGKIATRHVKTGKSYYFDEAPIYSYAWHYYWLVNSSFRYQPIEDGTQKIRTSGPTSDTLQLQLLFANPYFNRSLDVEVECLFYVPVKSQRSTYLWRTSWSKCSAVCNGGKSIGTYKCFDVGKNITVDDKYCATERKISLVNKLAPCNTQPCEVKYAYKKQRWSNCSTCGTIGFRTRNITCLKTVQQSNEQQSNEPIIVSQDHCKDKPMPSTSMNCFVYCPKKKRTCNEKSRLCPSMLKKGHCKYNSVKTLCCKTCS